MCDIEGFIPSEEKWRMLLTVEMIWFLSLSGRQSIKCEDGSSRWVSIDATSDWVGDISRNGQKCCRVEINGAQTILNMHTDAEWIISAREMMAAVVAIMTWSHYQGETDT